MPQAISSLSGRVGAKHSLREPNAHPKAQRRMLRPYALPRTMMASRGPGRRHIRWDTPECTAAARFSMMLSKGV